MRWNTFPSKTRANGHSFRRPDNLSDATSDKKLIGDRIENEALKSSGKDWLVTKSGLHAIRFLGSDNVGTLRISVSIHEPI